MMKTDWSNIKTVFVDLDDTVWWFTENSKVALRHVYDKFGLAEYSPEYTHFRDIYAAKNLELWDLYHYGKIEKDFLVTERFRYTLEKIGVQGVDLKKLAADVDDEYLFYLSSLSKLVPGAKELLEYLVAKYDVNILSNGFQEVQLRKLRSSGIEHFIHHLVLSDDCGITKPLRGIFDYALDVTGATAETTVMIGDNYDADVQGAKNAGWHTVLFNIKGFDRNIVSDADVVVDSLEEIKSIL
ncbi:MAG: YjjG family noncanonical pyrimidine nucleotidase [Muribaculaceae bacterium]|nr:YjjG family noncanonical pyrimidine nucleotidase [Muribaculaceae bacterium]